MQWEVVLTGIWFLLGALRRACDFVIESVEARLNESFDAESRLPEGETEEFVDAMGDSPGEFKTEAARVKFFILSMNRVQQIFSTLTSQAQENICG